MEPCSCKQVILYPTSKCRVRPKTHTREGINHTETPPTWTAVNEPLTLTINAALLAVFSSDLKKQHKIAGRDIFPDIIANIYNKRMKCFFLRDFPDLEKKKKQKKKKVCKYKD